MKDIYDTARLADRIRLAAYKGHRPAADAAAVAMVRRAGGIMLGKTVTTEFAHLQPGKTRNPHNLEHTPGGSSSGSAAAVAAGMVPIATGIADRRLGDPARPPIAASRASSRPTGSCRPSA